MFFVGKSVPIYFRDSIFCSVVSLQAIFSLLSYQTEMLSARTLSGLQQRWLWSWLYRSRNRITTKHVTGMKQTPAKSCDQPVFPPSVLFAWWEIIISTTVRVITGKWKKKKKYWRRQEKNIEIEILLVFLHARYLSYLFCISDMIQVVFIKKIFDIIMICSSIWSKNTQIDKY